jgi:putative PIN family toxin of toxin-antitoxin system
MMMNRSLFVFDTNVLVSALILPNSTSQQALTKALKNGQIVQSLATLDELKQVIERDKFDKYLTREERLRFFTSLVYEAILVEITVSITECRDPKDNKFLELAISANAQTIISGDEDLLTLHPFRHITILKPSDFLS